MPLPPGPYEVRLANVGNPDYGQNPERPLPDSGRPRWVIRDTLADCRAAVREYIEDHDLGGGNWAGGEVRRAGQPGSDFARFSYNGRLWAGTDRSANTPELPVTH